MKTTTRGDVAKKASVLLVDDHPLLRQGLARLINDQPDLMVRGEAASPPQALAQIQRQPPELIVLDITLQGGDGLELCKQIHGRWPEIPVLVLSMHDEVLYAERALRAGASGYIMKQEPQEQVLTAMRRALRGDTYLSEAMSARLLRSIRGARSGAEVAPLERLSDRELEIFRLIGQGQSVKAIAQSLFLSPKTVEAHKEHIKQKLDLKIEQRTAAIRHPGHPARRVSWRFMPRRGARRCFCRSAKPSSSRCNGMESGRCSHV